MDIILSDLLTAFCLGLAPADGILDEVVFKHMKLFITKSLLLVSLDSGIT